MPANPAVADGPLPPATSFSVPAALMAVAGIAAIGAFATLFSIWARTTAPGIADTLRIASTEYAAGRPAVAAQIAQTVEFPEDMDAPDLFHLREFLIGAGLAAAADKTEDIKSWRLAMHEATPHLMAVNRHGFPPGREAEGKRLLGEALLSQGKFREASEFLGEAIAVDPSLRLQLMPLLAESQLLADTLPASAALGSAEKLLSWQTPGSIAFFETKLLSGRASLRLEQWPAAREKFRHVIDQCEQPGLVLEAKLLEASSQIAEAIALQKRAPQSNASAVVQEILGEALQTLIALDRESDPLLATRARLWMARAHQALNQPAEAIAAATSVRQHRPFNAESIAGGILEVELLAAQQRGPEVLQTVRYLVREIGDERLYDSRIVGLDEFRQRMTAAADRLRANGQFQTVVDLARTLPPVFSPDDAFMLEALAFSDWGEQTLRAGRGSVQEISREIAAAARDYYHSAGDAAAAAADIRFTTREYIPTLWSAITAYEKGRDFERTLELLENYLQYEDRALKPRALLTQGRVLLAIDQPTKALEPLNDCIIEHPRDSLRYEARLIAAMAHAELGQLVEARQLLDENLHDGTLAPASPVWRDSLYLLGKLLYRDAYENHLRLTDKVDTAPDGVSQPAVTAPATNRDAAPASGLRENQVLLENAIRRLEETAERERILVAENRLRDEVSRNEAISRAQMASYLAARSRQMAAYWPTLEAELPDVLDAAKRQLHQTRDGHLQGALNGFNNLRQTLARREEDRPLSDEDQALLRNCFLAGADVLREMGQLAEAAEAYRGVSLRYMNQPPALEAMLGQARCMEELGRNREAELIIRQAERVLQRIPETWDGQFSTTTRYDRQQWERLLAWLAPAAPAAGS